RDDVRAVLGVGLPRIKAALVARLAPLGLRWATVVHPSATLAPGVSLGTGSYDAAGAILPVNVRVGCFATGRGHGHIADGSMIGDLVSRHPDAHVGGEVHIGEGAEIGAGAVVLAGTPMGPWAVVGAGGVAVRPLNGGRTYGGVPARE